MKKVLSVLLCVAMLLSCVCLFAFADDAEPIDKVTIIFMNEGEVYDTKIVTKGDSFVGPENPTKPREDGDPEWAFAGWLGEDGNVYYKNTLPAATEDATYTATYKKLYDNEAEGNITIMSFLASIFARINKIFAQISTYLKDLTESVEKLMG